MRKWVFIGSAAAHHWFPSFREPHDIDVLSPVKVTSEKPSDLFVDTSWHDVAREIIDRSSSVFADPNILLTLKMSHASWPIFPAKTLSDIIFFKKAGILPINELIDPLKKVWTDEYGYRQVKMAVANEQFFADAVNRKIGHDTLHELLAFGAVPMHCKIRKDQTSPLCSKELFEALSFSEQIDCVLEEASVIAVERFNLSHSSRPSAVKIAFWKALQALATRLTTGWFNWFVIQNIDVIFDRRDIMTLHILNKLKGTQ